MRHPIPYHRAQRLLHPADDAYATTTDVPVVREGLAALALTIVDRHGVRHRWYYLAAGNVVRAWCGEYLDIARDDRFPTCLRCASRSDLHDAIDRFRLPRG